MVIAFYSALFWGIATAFGTIGATVGAVCIAYAGHRKQSLYRKRIAAIAAAELSISLRPLVECLKIGVVKAKLGRDKMSRTVYYAHLDYAHKQLSHWMGGHYELPTNYFVQTPCANVQTESS